MTRRAVWSGAASIAVFMGMVTTPLFAQEEAIFRNGYGPLRKLGRGIANVITCPAELIRTPELVGRREGMLTGATVGVLQGVGRMAQRGVVGLFEIATFYAEIPGNYQPLMKPELPFDEHGWAR